MYYFIVNPSASGGRGEKIWRKVERRLQNSGIEYHTDLTKNRGDARELAREYTENCREPRIIVAVGGDGTVNEILDGLSLDCQVTLGYIPAGTGNDLARSLKLPRNPVRCLKKVLYPRYFQCLDYGILSYAPEQKEPVYRRFAVSAGIGLDAAVCQELLEQRSRRSHRLLRFKRAAYVLVGLKHLLQDKPVKGYLILDGTKKVEFNHIYFMSFHIHPYEGGGFKMASRANSSDGQLEICVAHGAGRRKLVPVLVGAYLGRSSHYRGVRHYSCREVAVHVDRPMAVHVDGESCMSQTDLHLRCVEKKIRMIT